MIPQKHLFTIPEDIQRYIKVMVTQNNSQADTLYLFPFPIRLYISFYYLICVHFENIMKATKHIMIQNKIYLSFNYADVRYSLSLNM